MAIKEQGRGIVKRFRNWIIFTFRLYDCKRICWARAVMWAEFPENHLFSEIYTGVMGVDEVCFSNEETCYCGKEKKEANDNNQNTP